MGVAACSLGTGSWFQKWWWRVPWAASPGPGEAALGNSARHASAGCSSHCPLMTFDVKDIVFGNPVALRNFAAWLPAWSGPSREDLTIS